MHRFDYKYIKDESYISKKISEPYILEAYIPEKYHLECDEKIGINLRNRNELRHAVGGVAAHTLRYFSKNKEGFNVFRARSEAIWWLRHVYNSFKWWRAYSVNAEGERKDMPMLYVGETFGEATSYDGKEADIVLSSFENNNGIIDPNDKGGTAFAVGYSERGKLFNSPDKYATKTIVGKKYIGAGVSVSFSVQKNLQLMASFILKSNNKKVDNKSISEEIKNIKVVILDRSRHKSLIESVKKMGAQLILVKEDDLNPTFGITRGEIDFITGVGGVPEGVLSAMIVEKLGGEMTFRILPDAVANNNDLLTNKENWNKFQMDEIEILKKFHLVPSGSENPEEVPFNNIFTSRDLAKGNDMVFTASIIKETRWIKDKNGKTVPGVKIDPATGELTVHTIRIAENDVEVVPIIYKTAINKYKEELKQELTIKEHADLHLHLANVYAEFGLFDNANESLSKALNDRGIQKEQRIKFKRMVEYIKGLEFLTKSESFTLKIAAEHFYNASLLAEDDSDGLRPRQMIKRIYEFIGDECYRKKDYKIAIGKYKKALQFAPHELKLYRKINTSDMKPILEKYFELVNIEYEKQQEHTIKEWDKIKLIIALKIFHNDSVFPTFIGGQPWLIFFRRTVMHNLSLSFKVALLIKLKILFNNINYFDDYKLREFLDKEYSLSDECVNAIINYRKKNHIFRSVSELYLIDDLEFDCLVQLLIPAVKVYAYNELESADIPLTISRCEAVEIRSENILREISESYKEDAQEHSYAVGESYHYVGMALYDVGDFPGSRIYYGKAIKKFREIIEKFVGITPVNAQYRIGNMFEEMALLFVKRKKYYIVRAVCEYKKIVDEDKAIRLFGKAYRLNTARIDQATKKITELTNNHLEK